MATASALAKRVLRVIQDAKYSETVVLGFFNDCAKKISERYIIPNLDVEGTITTVTNLWSVPVPANFQRNLYFALGPDKQSIFVIDSKEKLMACFNGGDTTKTGIRAEGVAAVGGSIFYAPIPVEAQTITLSYQRKPTTIVAPDEIDLLPGYTSEQDEMMVNYACWKIFSEIEQGVEGAKVDTSYYSALFTGAFDELRLVFREGVSLPPRKVAQMNPSW